jgi:hypothetical protein
LDWTGLSPTPDWVRPDWWNHWNDSKRKEKPMYQYLPVIPVANGLFNIEDGLDNEQHSLNNHNGTINQSEDGHRSNQLHELDCLIEYCEQ